jgi:uncharacterized protein GlcG (DUF336 family)
MSTRTLLAASIGTIALMMMLSAAESVVAESIPAAHRLPATLAHDAVGEAVAACASQGFRVTATVINPDGVRLATLHGDGSGLHTIEASYAKAYAAVSFAAPVLGLDTSGALGEKFQQQPGFQPPAGMLFRAGGVVIKLDNVVVGAIGVGGAPSANNDETCARAGIAKSRDRLQ